MIKSNIYIVFIIILLACGFDEANCQDFRKITEGLAINNYKFDKNIKIILIVPENSCKGCLNYFKKELESLSKNKNLHIVYLRISEDMFSEKLQIIDYYIYEKFFSEVYGITLYFVKNKKISSFIEILPKNIEPIFNILSNKSLSNNKISMLKVFK